MQKTGWNKLMIRVCVCCFYTLLCLSLSVAVSFSADSPRTSATPVQAQSLEDQFDQAYSTHSAQNQHDEALKVAEQAIIVNPVNWAWRKKAAGSAELAGKRSLALAHWLFLSEMGDGTARQSALRLSRTMNEFSVSHYLLEKMLLLGSADPELLKEYVAVTEKLGISHESYDLLAPKLTSESRALLLKEQAMLAEQLGKASEAVNALSRLALIRPLTPEESIQQAKLMHGQGDLAKAWQAAQGAESGQVTPADVRLPPAAEEKMVPLTPPAPIAALAPDEPRRSYAWTSSAQQRAERQFFLIEPPKVAALLKYDYNREDHISGGQKSIDSAHTVSERVDLVTSGFIYHPALLEYNLKFSPEFRQSIQTRSELRISTASGGSGFSPNYYANMALLGQKPYTLSLYSQRIEDQVWSTYNGVSKTTTESYGGDLNLKYSLLPTTIGGSISTSDQIDFYVTNSEWREAHLYSRHRGVTGDTSLTANYSISQQVNNNAPNDIKTLNTNLSNQHEITQGGRVNLASNLQYTNQKSSVLENVSFQANEILSWEHDKQLRSRYSASFRQSEASSSKSTWLSLDARVIHQLYENLNTTAGLTGTGNNSIGTEERSLAGMLNSTYQRRLSTWGNLGLNAGWSYLYTTRSGAQGTTQVVGEPQTLNSLVETYLTQSSVVPGSVVVTNSAGAFVYVQDVDYQLDLIGSRTRISRLPLGAIVEGQMVLVNYSFVRDAGYDDAVLTQNYGINFDFRSSLYLSYRYLHAQQYLLAGPPPDRKNNAAVHLLALRYLLGWTETGASYEDNVGADSSYTRWEVSEAIRVRPSNWFQLNLRGYYGATEYRSHQDQRKTFGGTTSLNWTPATWMRFELEGYLEQLGSDLEKSTNSGAKALLGLQYRLWNLRLGYKLSEQDNRMSHYKRTSQMMQMELSRALR